jgi:hypothetical protein
VHAGTTYSTMRRTVSVMGSSPTRFTIERIDLCTRMRRFLVRFIRPEAFVHTGLIYLPVN